MPDEDPELDPQGPVTFRVEVPAEMTNGVYSNFCSVWHGPHDFTLDFAVTGQAEQVDVEQLVVPTRIVARIRIPLTMAQDLLRAVSTQVATFEETNGPIHKPGDDRPWYPPPDLT